jgi:nitroreductase
MAAPSITDKVTMVRGSEHRKPAHAIDPLFIDRWSARAMSGEPLSRAELMVLFEAARWAPSSNNFQPWRMLYALRDGPGWPVYLSLLNERNRIWGREAGALVVFISKLTFDDGRPCNTHSYDTGAAWENFALQASERRLVVHGIQGFDYERARVELQIPEDFHVDAMAVVGKPGDKDALPDSFRQREQPNDRRPLEQTVCEGTFSL